MKQPPERCGSAALSEVMSYWKTPGASEDALAAEVYTPRLAGSLTTDMAAAARRRGLVVRAGPSSGQELRRAVLDGMPVVVLITLSPHILGRNHYLVVKGLDSQEGYLLCDYGVRSDVVLRPGPFPSDWRSAGNWALYCWPPEKSPEWALPLEDLRAGALLERAGKTADAARAYSRAAAKDPKLWEAHFNLGNLRLAAGQPAEAADHYRRALAIRPEEPDVINNLAWALFDARKDPEQAEGLARSALEKSPGGSMASARASHTLGVILAWRGKDAEARQSFSAALTCAEKLGDADLAASVRKEIEKLTGK